MGILWVHPTAVPLSANFQHTRAPKLLLPFMGVLRLCLSGEESVTLSNQ
jgi:hypothetical protein